MTKREPTISLHEFEQILDRKLKEALDAKLAENLAPLYARLRGIEARLKGMEADIELVKAATWDRLEEERNEAAIAAMRLERR